MATITSANVVFMLSVPGVFTTPQTLQGYSMEDIFDHDMTEISEVQLGADGIGVAGYVPRLNKQTISFLASSPTNFSLFEAWIQAQDTNGPDIIYASGFLRYPSIGRKYTLYQGALTRGTQAPSAGKVLKTRQFEITWMPPAPGQPPIFGQPL